MLQESAPTSTRSRFTRLASTKGTTIQAAGRRTVADLLPIAVPMVAVHVTADRRIL